ncbi:MAG: hypothetical protein K0Q60_1805 [Microvirga sp.]|nr:hypothetical protein [Microvirga sp.]
MGEGAGQITVTSVESTLRPLTDSYPGFACWPVWDTRRCVEGAPRSFVS